MKALFIIPLGLILIGCSHDAGATECPPEEAYRLVQSGALLVDVRSEAEYAAGHLPEALLISHDKIDAQAAKLGQDRSRPVVLYCRSGRRSGIAKRTLEQLGFTAACNAGGFDALSKIWSSTPKPSTLE